jgi:hypothetical protein
VSAFVGRVEPLARLLACYDACCAPAGADAPTWPQLALVTGEAGIGKTALLTRFTQAVSSRGATAVWGTCWDAEQAPAWWPWTQALRSLLLTRPDLDREVPARLRALISGDTTADPTAVHDASGRVRLLGDVSDLLRRAAVRAPLVVVLDDLQWSDASSRELVRMVVRQPGPSLMIACSYRPEELPEDAAADIAALAAVAEHMPLRALRVEEVTALVNSLSGAAAARRWGRRVYSRSGGHPFFARELCHLIASGDPAADVPDAVREVVVRRVHRLSSDCRGLLDIAAVAGPAIRPGLLADLVGQDVDAVGAALQEATAAGVLVAGRGAQALWFAHDLFRETIFDQVPPLRRRALHARIGQALVRRYGAGRPAFASELARHFAASAPLTGAGPALEWARAAAATDTQRFAFGEAAGHLARVRDALADADVEVDAAELVALLCQEGDLWLRHGSADRARGLVDEAWRLARASGRAELLGPAALGIEACGARFAMPRTELIAVLDQARTGLVETATPLEARVTAALARQLQHSVPADRPRAAPLAQEAVRLARTLDDPATLASCLLAEHDALWTPGTAARRIQVAQEIAVVARRLGDGDRLTQALLLVATAQLESGSPAFRATLAEFDHLASALHQPRHDYTVATRRAALAVLDGDLDRGDQLSLQAERLGHAVGDPDTGNVRMSQRLEIARARHDPEELADLAVQAVRWWVGLPTHAHAIAAGFLARAGDLDGARRELDTVLAMDWHSDRSYMWALYIGEIAAAAAALGDDAVCAQVLDDLHPLRDSCAVGGALVSFMGSHAHTVGLLQAALGDLDAAVRTLEGALATHRRLGARSWVQETAEALAGMTQRRRARPQDGRPALLRTGGLWEVRYGGRTAHVRDSKGMHDLSVLLSRPGVDVPALDLADGGVVDPVRGQPVLDRTALSAYRRRLGELEAELDEARSLDDLASVARATAEREAIAAGLRRATRPGGRTVALDTTSAERARKAVSARIRDAIRRIEQVLPELGAHLDRSVRTGTSCRYLARPGPGLSAPRATR